VQISYEPLRGFKDYVPPESDTLSWIAKTFEDVVRRFGYREVRTPTVESFQLFALKSGEEIRESMFVFKDKAGREVALRPEITPSVVRVYLKEMRHWPKPIRLYYVGNVFRYDEPQFGRFREFTQAGVEILGADGLHYDVELIEILEDFYDSIDLKKRMYKVNNIAVFKELAKRAGVEGSELDRFLRYLDKGMHDKAAELLAVRGAVEEARAVEALASMGGNTDRIEFMRRALSGLGNAESLLRHVDTLEKYVEMVRSIGANVVVEPAFARGIAYYTSIIFEVVVPGFPISIAGGGRYDDLTCVYGGESLSTTGFAAGIERTMLALASEGKTRHVGVQVLLVLLVDDPSVYARVYETVKMLRTSNISVQYEVQPSTRLGRWLEYASKYSIDYVIIVGRKELEKGVATVRDMKSWSQSEVRLEDLIKVFTRGGEVRGTY